MWICWPKEKKLKDTKKKIDLVIQKNSTLQIIQQILEAAVQEMSDFMWTLISALLADVIQHSTSGG